MESSKASVPSCWQNLPSWNVQPASWLCELWLAPSLQLTAFCAAGWQPKMGLQLDWRFKREAAGKCLTPNYVCVCVCVCVCHKVAPHQQPSSAEMLETAMVVRASAHG